MARVKLGSGFSSINGSIGGTTFQNSAAGTIAKNKGSRCRSSSTQANSNRGYQSVLSAFWSTSPQANRDLWDAYALFKPTPQYNNSGRFITGQQMFTKYNYALLSTSIGFMASPVFSTDVAPPRSVTITNTAGVLTIDVNDNIDESSEFLMFKISGQMKSSQKRPVGGVKQINPVFGGTSSADITSAYTALYGAVPPVGSFVFVSYQVFAVTHPNWTFLTEQKLEVQ